MGIEDEALPESDVGREFALERMSNEEALGAAYALKGKPNDTIMKLQRTNPHYKVFVWGPENDSEMIYGISSWLDISLCSMLRLQYRVIRCSHSNWQVSNTGSSASLGKGYSLDLSDCGWA